VQYAQLRAFHAVAEYGGFSKAAQALSLTQPAVSDHVKRLEQDYGVKLFERGPRGVETTELGLRLFSVTRQMLARRAATARIGRWARVRLALAGRGRARSGGRADRRVSQAASRHRRDALDRQCR